MRWEWNGVGSGGCAALPNLLPLSRSAAMEIVHLDWSSFLEMGFWFFRRDLWEEWGKMGIDEVWEWASVREIYLRMRGRSFFHVCKKDEENIFRPWVDYYWCAYEVIYERWGRGIESDKMCPWNVFRFRRWVFFLRNRDTGFRNKKSPELREKNGQGLGGLDTLGCLVRGSFSLDFPEHEYNVGVFFCVAFVPGSELF